MKVTSATLFIIGTFLYGTFDALAKGAEPPVPSPTGKPIPPPGLPIDENIILLTVFGLIFGLYTTYKYIKKPKPSL